VFSRVLAIVFLTVIPLVQAAGQDVKVHGYFQSDSLKIGEVVPYSLTARYPSSINVIFPDSGYSFAPFELLRKKYFQTFTKNNISLDSVVYFLVTYEVDSLQTLRLPAFVVHVGDCTIVYSNTDSIILKQLVHLNTDSLTVEKLPLKTNTDYLNVSWLLNYPLLLIAIGILIVALIVLWIIFGKRIVRYYKIKRLTRKHAEFVQKFSASVHDLQQNFSSDLAESIFVLWKKYMENLVSRPYTRYTSREILKMEKDESLGNALRALNKIIYAGINPATDEPFTQLQKYTELQFVKKTEELKHG
jgi:hypothetical protein